MILIIRRIENFLDGGGARRYSVIAPDTPGGEVTESRWKPPVFGGEMEDRLVINPRLISLFVEIWNRNNPERWLWASEINWGWCYQFALVVHGVYGGELVSSSGHAWVSINGIDYDCNFLDGDRIYSFGYPEVQDRATFVSYWSVGGGSGPVDERTINEVIQEFTRLTQNRAA